MYVWTFAVTKTSWQLTKRPEKICQITGVRTFESVVYLSSDILPVLPQLNSFFNNFSVIFETKKKYFLEIFN